MRAAARLATLVIVEKCDRRRVLRLSSRVPVDVRLVDALARLQLACRRRGARLHLEDVSPALEELVTLAGLSRELGLDSGATPPASRSTPEPLL
jgi:hypothetical protein